MKTKSCSALLLATLTAIIGTAAPTASHADPAPVVASAPGDYLPHLAHAYRMGYCAGRNDRACGLDRNYRRAFEASGSGWESYFQEGYADGYECRPMNH